MTYSPSGAGNDQMFGDNESFLLTNSLDWMWGEDGNDTLDGGSQPDYIFGGLGNDNIIGDSNSLLLVMSVDFVSGGDGADTINGGNGLDVIFGGNGNDNIKGDDEVFDQISPDVILGGAGDDTIDGGAATDLIVGGDGADTLQGDSNNLLFLLSSDLTFGGDGPDNIDGGNGMDFVFGQNGNDNLLGDNSTLGEFSQDFVFGGAGDDMMDGGASSDFLYGDAGNDTMYGDLGLGWMLLSIDVMLGGDDCDTMLGGLATDFMYGNAGVDRMDGQWGLDVMAGGDNSDTMNGGDFIDVIVGGGGNDLIYGDDGLDILLGSDGDDCLYGGNDVDLVFGGNGNDCTHGDDGWDQLWGDDGNDTVFGDNGSDILIGGDGDDQLDGGGGADALSGGSGDDVLWGGPGLDLLIGGLGTDTKHQRLSSGLFCNCVTEFCPQYDFGDAPDSYGTLLPNGPQQPVTGPRLGSLIDIDMDGMPSTGANGDDTTGQDDEDGVTISGLMVGSLATAHVVLSNAVSAKLDAWVDFNNNFVFDPSEQIFSSTTISAGTNVPTFAVPVTAVAGVTYARFRVSTTGGLLPTGLAGPGEVEDYQVNILPPSFDFGDAPTPYGTLLLSDGARHLSGGPRLGSRIDLEPTGAPSTPANGDDQSNLDDEDGVTLSVLTVGSSATATVILSGVASAKLDAWIDFNLDGVFDDPAEKIFSSTTIISGANPLTFTVPGAAEPGSSYARFRVSAVGGLAPVGFGNAGEVEDYAVSLKPAIAFDYGDAPDTYGTHLSSNGPRHTIDGPRLGSLIDVDVNGMPSIGANFDDTTGVDDEDGVLLSALVAGGTTTATVTLTNAASAKLDAWIDFDQNGFFDDPTEKIFSSASIVSGLNLLTFPVQASATSGSSFSRFRVSTTGGLAPLGFGGAGEVEDHPVGIEGAPSLDYGDALDTYGTTLWNNGPRHTIAGPRLGSRIDMEPNGVPSIAANGDDLSNLDDEDGVALPTLIIGGTTTATVTLSNAAAAKLDAWVDFDRNGIFNDPAEKIFSSVSIVSGLNTLIFPVPATAMAGNSYARFRVSLAGGLTPLGVGDAGEVDDYAVSIDKAQNLDFGDAPDTYGTFQESNGPRHPITGPRLGNLIDQETNGAPTIAANGDDLAGVDDEDGVILPAMTVGNMTTATVTLGNAVSARLDAWIDFNLDGIFDDLVEKIFSNTTIVAGVNTLTFAVPTNATPGLSYSRFRVSATGGLTPLGAAGPGEVEDYRVGIQKSLDLDYGDAPDAFGTLLASDGPRHSIAGPRLGSRIDIDPDGAPSFGADGDNLLNLNDEDGVLLSALAANQPATATVTLTNAATAKLDAWPGSTSTAMASSTIWQKRFSVA